MGKIKNYVLDTNVLIHNPEALFFFQENNLYVPLKVLDELDRFKSGSEERNVNARATIRTLEELTKEGINEEGIKLKSGGKLYFLDENQTATKDTPKMLSAIFSYLNPITRIIRNRFGYADDDLINLVEQLQQQKPQEHTCLVTKDLNLRIKARKRKLNTADYEHDKAAVDLKSLFSFDNEFVVPQEYLARLWQETKAPVPKELKEALQINQYLTLRSLEESDPKKLLFAQYKENEIMLIKRHLDVEGIKPRNSRQRALLEACLNPETSIVSALGRAGTGKTLLAIAAGLSQVLPKGGYKTRNGYQKIIVFRPLVEAGRAIGYLPGGVEEKIEPYFKPVQNLVNFVLGDAAFHVLYSDKSDFDKIIQYEPVTHIKGDTINDAYILVDEAQNFTQGELKLIGTRMGMNCKIVYVGDPFQCDLPYNSDERDNALSVLTFRANKMENPAKRKKFCYVLLHEVERSLEAEIFTEIL